MSSNVRSARRRRAGVALILAFVLIAAPGCRLAYWGPSDDSGSHSNTREIWEVPVGVVVLPVGFTIDVAISLAINAAALVAFPVNWAVVSFDSDPIVPGVYIFAGTATGATLLNPSANLDWSWSIPGGGLVRALDLKDEVDREPKKTKPRSGRGAGWTRGRR